MQTHTHMWRRKLTVTFFVFLLCHTLSSSRDKMICYIPFQIYVYAFANICVCVHLYLHTLDIYTNIYDLHILSILLYIMFCKLISLSIYHRCILIPNFPLMTFYHFTLPPRGMLSNILSSTKWDLTSNFCKIDM